MAGHGSHVVDGFRHPRLAALYDLESPWGPDDDFFLALAEESGAARIADVGCGTGRLTLALAAHGHTVTAADPAAAMLAIARGKPGAGAVAWVEGTAGDLPDDSFELALMTSHVAQVFVDDGEWLETLAEIGRSLVRGGRLAFDMRDPRACAWQRWDGAVSHLVLPDGSAVESRLEVRRVLDGVVSFTSSYGFAGGETLTAASTLRFRSEDDLHDSLRAAGFAVESIYGGWERQPPGAGAGELIVVARSVR